MRQNTGAEWVSYRIQNTSKGWVLDRRQGYDSFRQYNDRMGIIQNTVTGWVQTINRNRMGIRQNTGTGWILGKIQ